MLRSSRAKAALILTQVIQDGRSATAAIEAAEKKWTLKKDRSLIKELVFGSLRFWFRLDTIANKLLETSLRKKDTDIYCLIVLGIYQLLHTEVPDHAAISETVSATKSMNKPWAKNLVNALLRRVQRDKEAILQEVDTNPAVRLAHPKWLYQKIKKDWPESYLEILASNNAKAPMTLRVNVLQTSRNKYLKFLAQENIEANPHPLISTAIILAKGVDVFSLPLFEEGYVSVQDAASQAAAEILEVKSNQLVVDACAAPGGKTSLLLETYPKIKQLWALDNSSSRIERIVENLDRLKLDCKLICTDAADIENWSEGEKFDRILLDAPCSATGVIRRNPDVKYHRRPEDINSAEQQQWRLLEALWQILKPNGILLYSTCSILKQENYQQIEKFLATTKDAKELPINGPLSDLYAEQKEPGLQIFPGSHQMDGFYYAKLKKSRYDHTRDTSNCQKRVVWSITGIKIINNDDSPIFITMSLVIKSILIST